MRIPKPVSPCDRTPSNTHLAPVLSTLRHTGRGIVRLFLSLLLTGSVSLVAAAQTYPVRVSGSALDPQGRPPGANDQAHPPQLTGTVDDPGGAMIAGAAVQVQ